MDALLHDLRSGARKLTRNHGFTVVVALVLALGIGANTAVFSVVNTVLLRPLPYRDPDRLVIGWDSNLEMGLDRSLVSYRNYLDWARDNSVFESQAAFGHSAFTLSSGVEPERVWGLRASAGLFPALGVDPLHGRTIRPEEDRPGGEPVVVLSYGLWQRTFAGNAEIVGGTVKLNGESFTVIGVMPPGFKFPLFPQNIPVDLWVPMAPSASERPRSSRSVLTVAKLREGVTLQQAQAELNTIAARLQLEYPDVNANWTLVLVPLHEQVVGPVRPALLLLLGAVGLVLLIACANVANMMLAQAVTRRREMALRAALGAGRVRIVRQLLTESLMLAMLGGALGLLAAHWGLRLLVASVGAAVPRLDAVVLDGRVLGFSVAISLLTGVIFGLIPALQASRPGLHEALKEKGGQPAARIGRLPVRSVLMVIEVALALVLLIGGALLVKSFGRLMDVDPGFDAQSLLTMEILLPEPDYPQEHQVRAFQQELLERTASLPGVRSTAIVNFLPMGGYRASRQFTIDERSSSTAEKPRAEERSVNPEYFRTMGIALIAGRRFTDRDDEDTPAVVIISNSMARRYWPDEDPIGRRLTTSSLASFLRPAWGDRYGSREIVGVVSDVHYLGLMSPVDDVMYLPHLQDPWPWMALVVKTQVDPLSLVGAVRGEVRKLDPNAAPYKVMTMEGVISGTVAQDRFKMLLLGGFAALAMILAAVGIYGVMSYTVSQRTHEVGVRLALGAKGDDVVQLIVRHGMLLALIGVTLGAAGAFAFTRMLSGWLFGVTATDPMTFASICLIMLGVALVACLVPARRAARVDPVVSLRAE